MSVQGRRETRNDWPVRRLRALADVTLGRQRSPKHASGPHMVPYLRAANVLDGRLDLTDVKEMNFTPNEQVVYGLKPGDVLITEGSGSLDTVGASAVWSGDLGGVVCFQNTLLRARPRRGMDPRYLAWWCRSAFVSGLFASVATGANIFHLSAERVRSIQVVLPSPRVQTAIANFLDRETARIGRLIERKRVLAERLEERLNALVSRAFESDGSSAVRLKHVTSEPLKYGANEPGTYEEQTWPRFIRTSDVTDDGELRDDTFKSLPPHVARRYMLEDGDLLLTRSGATVGKGIRHEAAWGPACFAGYMIRARPDRRKVVPRYLEHFTRSASYWQQVDLSIWQATIQNISAERYGNFALPRPSVPEQERIARQLDEETRRTKALIGSLTSQVELLRERREILIAAAVTGELNVGQAP